MNESSSVLSVKDIIKSPNAISEEGARNLLQRIRILLDQGQQFTICFEGIDLVIAYFLNIAIGSLYGIYPWPLLSESLKIQGLDSQELADLELVVANAKRHFLESPIPPFWG